MSKPQTDRKDYVSTQLQATDLERKYGASRDMVKRWRGLGLPCDRAPGSLHRAPFLYERDVFETWVLETLTGQQRGKTREVISKINRRRGRASQAAAKAAGGPPKPKPSAKPSADTSAKPSANLGKKKWAAEETVVTLKLADEGADDDTIWEYLRDELGVTRNQWYNQRRKHPLLFEDVERRRTWYAERQSSALRTVALSSPPSSDEPGGEASWTEGELALLSQQGVVKLEQVRQALSGQLEVLKRVKDPDGAFPTVAVMRNTLFGVQRLLEPDSDASSKSNSEAE